MIKKNKKTVILCVIIIIVAIILGGYKVATSYLFNLNGSITDEKDKIIERIQNINDIQERKKQIDLFVEKNVITQEEANELY